MTTDVSTKKCPFCGEMIKAEAIKCRFCGEFLEPVDTKGKRIDTGGGAYVAGGVTTGKDFIGRDKNVHGDEVGGDKISGTVGNNATNVAIGKDIHQTHTSTVNAPIFDQRGQKVNYQYNAAGNINFGAVQNQMDVAGELEKLQAEVVKAVETEVLDEDVATDVKYKIEKATQQAKKPTPDKKTIIDYLNQAKTLIAGVTAAAGLVTGLTQAIEAVSKLF